MIKVSQQAKTKLEQLLAEEGKSFENAYVRVGVISGGCSGLSYNLSFDTEKLKTTNYLKIMAQGF